jgi:hypothetical protein
MHYGELIIAVKFVKLASVTKEDVIREAEMMKCLADPSLPHVFGVCTKSKLYLIITLFHGVLKDSVPASVTFKDCLQLEKYPKIYKCAYLVAVEYRAAVAMQYRPQATPARPIYCACSHSYLPWTSDLTPTTKTCKGVR